MPFKSEAQRRYLWANEPEIARDWTDTYGSRIQAALGGIMASRVGFQFGGNPHEATKGSKNAGQTTGGVTSGDDAKAQHIQNQIKTQLSNLKAHKEARDPRELAMQQYSTNPYGQKTKGFLSGIKGLYSKFGLIPNAWRFGKKLFGPSVEDDNPYSTGRFTMGNPHLEGPTVDSTQDRGGEGIIPMAPFLYDNYYADVDQNLYDDDETVTEVDDFVQRFRVADPYRQNLYKGVEDTPITYT